MFLEAWVCFWKLETSTEIIRNDVKTYCCISGFQAVLLYWLQGLYLLRPLPAWADLTISTIIKKPCTSRKRGQSASCFMVTPWFLCSPYWQPTENLKNVCFRADLWLVFIIQTKTKPQMDSFAFFRSCLSLYMWLPCYTPSISVLFTETINFRKLLGFENFKTCFSLPINTRNSLEGILAVEEKKTQ